MAVIVKYVVVRDEKEDMTFTTKKEADAYDRMLDIAEELYAFLQTAEVEIPEDKLDDLSFFMAKHRESLSTLLKGGAVSASKAKVAETPAAKDKASEPMVVTNDNIKDKGPEGAKASRTVKPRTVAA